MGGWTDRLDEWAGVGMITSGYQRMLHDTFIDMFNNDAW